MNTGKVLKEGGKKRAKNPQDQSTEQICMRLACSFSTVTKQISFAFCISGNSTMVIGAEMNCTAARAYRTHSDSARDGTSQSSPLSSCFARPSQKLNCWCNCPACFEETG